MNHWVKTNQENETTSPTSLSEMMIEMASETCTWRHSIDSNLRKQVETNIFDYLHALKPNAPSQVMEKLSCLAQRMEEILWKQATNELEYKDISTLPQRLTIIQQNNAKILLSLPQTKKRLNEEQARIVFSCLQSWRQKLVHLYDTTPWEILPNHILAKVAVCIPSSFQELVMCGISQQQVERFGNSLLLELHKIVNVLHSNGGTHSLSSHSTNCKRLSPASKAKPATLVRKGDKNQSIKRGQGIEVQGSKRRRKDVPALQVPGQTLLPQNTMMMHGSSEYLSPTSFVTPTSLPVLLQRPTDSSTTTASTPTGAQLPTILPSPMSSLNGIKKPPYINSTPISFAQYSRLPIVSNEQPNHLHDPNLVNQPDSHATIQVYEKEIQTLRWLLMESQREKAQLEEEVLQLRQQVYQQSL